MSKSKAPKNSFLQPNRCLKLYLKAGSCCLMCFARFCFISNWAQGPIGQVFRRLGGGGLLRRGPVHGKAPGDAGRRHGAGLPEVYPWHWRRRASAKGAGGNRNRRSARESCLVSIWLVEMNKHVDPKSVQSQGIPHLTNSNLWNLRHLPPRLVVLGAGVIGLEIAQAMRRLGSQAGEASCLE